MKEQLCTHQVNITKKEGFKMQLHKLVENKNEGCHNCYFYVECNLNKAEKRRVGKIMGTMWKGANNNFYTFTNN